jgi:ribokinase
VLLSLGASASSESSFHSLFPSPLLTLPSISLVTYVENFPKIGETIIGKSFEQKFGGKGANQAVILSRLGTQCGFCAMLGTDLYGTSYFEQLMKERVMIPGISRTSEAPTGVACITVADGGANMIIINPGANSLLSPAIVSSILPSYAHCAVMVCQNEIPPETTLAALQIGSQLGMLTIFNPAPISDKKETLWEAILQADIVCPNETELFELLDRTHPVDTENEIEIAASQLIHRGAKIVIVTMGSRGALVVTRQLTELIPAPVVENCLDTVGAGDCFVGKNRKKN